MQPAPIPPNESARLAALHRLQMLDTTPEAQFDRITELARAFFGVPMSALSFVDGERQWYKAGCGLMFEQTPRGPAFCAHTILTDGVLVVPDAARDERFADNPMVTGGPRIRFYAAAAVHGPEGQAVGALCILDREPREFSERERGILAQLAGVVSDALARRAETAQREAAARARSTFLAGLSHDLRAPLTAILGFTDLLSDDGLEADQRREYVGTIERNGKRLLSVLNDIVDYTRLEAGALPVEDRVFPIADLLDDVRREILPLARERQLAFEVEIDPRAATTMRSDPSRVRQVLSTLSAAAVRQAAGGSVTLHLRPAAGGRVRFDVVDDGAGVSGEQAARLLVGEPASRGPGGKSGRHVLALRVCQMLARLLKGELTAVSSPAAGTVFSVMLPAFRAGTPLVTGTAEVLPEPGERPLDRVRVLVVDDNVDNQRLMSLQLRQAGAVVAVVGGGGAAVDALTAEGRWPTDPMALPHFDVVLLTMQLPGLDGYGVARRLRELNHPATVIAMSSAPSQDDARRCAELGCAGYLVRPADRETVVSAVRHLLRLADFTPVAA